MKWIVLLVLAACGTKKDANTDKPAAAPVGSASVDASTGGSGAGSARVPTGEEAVAEMTAIGDEMCACKDEACLKPVIEKAVGLNAKYGTTELTPDQNAKLAGVMRKAQKCMRAIQKGMTGPTDPRLKPPTAEDLATYLKGIPGTGKLTTTITTSLGAFHCELYTDKAPMTVANFVGLATGKKPWRDSKSGAVVENKPFFNGLIFHRVIPGFMIQGGDPLGLGSGGPGYEFEDEVDNGLVVEPGSLAMANSGPATNGSQFFVMESRAAWLDNKHTVFGKCAEVDLVKTITGVEKECPTCDENDPKRDRPKTPVTIKSVTFSRT